MNFDLRWEKPDMKHLPKCRVTDIAFVLFWNVVFTLASLLMVQHREAEVMLWVKLEATSTEYLEGKALDSQ